MGLSFEPIEALRKRLVAWKKDLPELTIDVTEEFEANIVDMITEEQLNKGIESTGKPIRPKYTPFTIQIKREKRQPFDRVTLKDTGAFHKSINVRFGRLFFVVYATDEKFEKLEKKYGKKILGLTKESLQELRELILDDLVLVSKSKI